MIPDISVIIPIKDERDNLVPLIDDLHAALGPTGWTYEFVVVDDGSSDGSVELLRSLAEQDRRLRIVVLRRNFGQSAALKAGIDWSEGRIIVTMDGDRQNDPADVPMLVRKLDEGYDAVLGRRAHRQDGFMLRKLPSWLGNWVIRKVTGVTFKDFGCTQRAMRRDLAESLPLYGEMHRFISVLAVQYGARMTQVDVHHHPRTAGQSKYNLTRTVRVLLDLITVQFLHGYLTRPMHVFGVGGLICMAAGMLCLVGTVVVKAFTGLWMTGNPFLHLGILLEVVGVQFISLGLLGEVLARIYFESQGKPSYTVRDVVNAPGGDMKQAA